VNRIVLGILLGLALGTLAVLLMLPMKFPDKKTALAGAFTSRFALGFLAVNAVLPVPSFVSGAIVGLLVSIPDAIITKAYVPIIVTGIAFGAFAGWAGHAWGA
jgi:ABC-type transport system involved in cytochrome c biogenesis permease subunit